MSVVLILLIASLTVALGFLGAFIWSVKTGQYDDDYTPSVRILFEDKPKEELGFAKPQTPLKGDKTSEQINIIKQENNQ